MEKNYFVILGDTENRHYENMLQRLKKLGNYNKILDNLYLLSIADGSEFDNLTKIRTYIAGERLGYCMVITVTPSLKCAWNVPGASCDVLVKTFKQLEKPDEK